MGNREEDQGASASPTALAPPSGAKPASGLEQSRSSTGARFYIDCEFDGHGGPLLSFGIESDVGRGLHYRVIDAPPVQDPWVAKNVVPLMGRHGATLNYRGPLNALGPVLRKFIEPCDHPVIIADSPVDIGRFCQAISTNAEGGWASTEYPLMRFEVHNVDCWPNDLVGGVQHNAWWDAKALRHVLASADTRRMAETGTEGRDA